jgi:glutaredoxin 3
MSIVDLYIDKNKITIFSKTNCNFCTKAQELLNMSNISYIDINIDNIENSNIFFQLLKQKTNHKTLPNIFINGTHIGGYSELKKKHESGDLLNVNSFSYICNFCGKEFNTSSFDCSCFQHIYDDWGRPI